MKKLTLLTILFVFWSCENSSENKKERNTSNVPTETGSIKLSPTGGKWKTIPSNSNQKLHDVVISAHGSIYVAGDNGTLLEFDSKTHSFKQLGQVINKNFTAIHAYSASTVYSGTSDGAVYRKRQNENRWSRLNTGLTINRVIDLYFSDNNHGYMSYLDNKQNLGIAYTADSGNSWTRSNYPAVRLYSGSSKINALPGGKFYMACSKGLLKSNDNGKNWSLITFNTDGSFPCISDFYDEQNGVVGSFYYSGVLYTENGSSFTKIKQRITSLDIRYLTEKTIYIVARSFYRIYKSNDGGKSFSNQPDFEIKNSGSTGFFSRFRSIDTANGNLAVVVGDEGKIYYLLN